MPTLQIDPELVNRLIKSGKIEDLAKTVEGIDPAIAKRIRAETDKLLKTPVDEFKELAGAGGSVMQGMWIALWQGLWIVLEPILPQIFNLLGKVDAIKQVATQDAFKELRPTPLDVGAALQFMHFHPDEKEEAIENLRFQGYSESRIRQLILAARSVINENDIGELWRRGEITQEGALESLSFLGYEQTNAETKAKTWTHLLGAGEIRELFLRGEIESEDALQRLSKLGFNNQDAVALTKLFWFIPPAQDLITMAVREVFNPEVAARFGQYEDFPEAFAEHAASLGISREWAQRYWAAHWDLPSIQMGFEMLHRGVIDISDLNLLLKAKDVMPFWRDKLTAISYNPLTRVDVRRMHKMGVLDLEGVKRSYLDVGYNDENADLMTMFTSVYNSRNERDLSKSEIVNSYIAGILDESSTLDLLLDMGYDEQESAIILTLAKLKEENKRKKDRIKIIKNKYVKSVITLGEVNSQLNSMNLGGKELALVTEEIELAMTDKAEELSLKELKVAFKKNVLLEADFKARLVIKGYKTDDINILVKVAKMGG